MTSYKIEVLGISKKRWKDNDKLIIRNGNTVICSDKENRGESRVGIIFPKISKKIQKLTSNMETNIKPCSNNQIQK